MFILGEQDLVSLNHAWILCNYAGQSMKVNLCVLNAANETRISFLDTADIYSNWWSGNKGGEAENIIGVCIKKNGRSRDKIILATDL